MLTSTVICASPIRLFIVDELRLSAIIELLGRYARATDQTVLHLFVAYYDRLLFYNNATLPVAYGSRRGSRTPIPAPKTGVLPLHYIRYVPPSSRRYIGGIGVQTFVRHIPAQNFIRDLQPYRIYCPLTFNWSGRRGTIP